MPTPDPHQPAPRSDSPVGRAERKQLIAQLFGPEMLTRLGHDATGATTAEDAAPGDPDRLAWQTNRLIRHLRDRGALTGAAPTTAAAATAPAGPPEATPNTPPKTPVRFAATASENLAAEHPAVIARILKSEPQTVRVAILRELPGVTARAVIRRLRSS